MRKSIICFFVLAGLQASAQSRSERAVFKGFEMHQTHCLSPSMRLDLQREISRNVDSLIHCNALNALPAGPPQQFAWPVKAANNLTDYGFHAMSGYADHNPAYPNQLSNFNCGDLTYDTNTGYNHQGSDFYIWPFAWNKMDSSLVEIVAAAPGVITGKQDGMYDRSCAMNGNPWNYVAVMHSDSSYVWYGHMKNGSVTTKNIGETVAQGEYLGIVGSSGNSTGPHLHFEVYDKNSNLIDPFAGPCNNWNTTSWWASQRPEIDPAINRIRTNSKPSVFPACPQNEIQNEEDYFWQLDTIYLMTYYRHLSTGDTVNITIYEPDNTVWGSWPWVSTWQFYVAAYMYYWIVPGSNAPSGMWRFRADYKGYTYEHNFFVGVVQNSKQINRQSLRISVFPNPVQGQLHIKALCRQQSVASFTVSDLGGRVLLHTEKLFRVGETRFGMDMGRLSGGVYMLSVKGLDFSENFRILKQ